MPQTYVYLMGWDLQVPAVRSQGLAWWMLYSPPSSRKALQTWKAEEPRTAPRDEPAHPEKAAMARNTDGLCLKARARGIWASRSPADGTVV